ncbi:MAG: VOC family protein [Pseudomonadota bacterium]
MIKSLSYVGFTTPDVDAWRTFAPDLLGLEVVSAADNDSVQLRVDEAAWRISVQPGPTNQIAFMGWDVGSADLLASSIEHLEAAHVTVTRGDAALAAARNVAEIAWFVDPAGFRHELTWGQLAGSTPFVPEQGVSGFVTGEQGLGHIVLMVPDLEAASDFYMSLLGFRHSDDIEAGMKIRFLHCNPRHHTLAISEVPGHRGVHHLMLQVNSIDDVGHAYDRVIEAGTPVAMGIGKHPNDEMTSFYVRTPSGFEIEYGTGGLEIRMDQEWPVGHFTATSTWGHKPPGEALMPGALQPVS